MSTAKVIALLATGLLSGAFMYGFLNVVPAFYEVPVNVHLVYRTQLMTHNGITMQSLMALSIITPLWYAGLCRRLTPVRNLAILSAALALTTLLITRFGNVPINGIIKLWPPQHPPVGWKALLHTWDIYNAWRTFTALGCFIAFIAASHLKKEETLTGSVSSSS
ncbi:putative membrane protein [Chitinophaga sp. W2I13]|uniref:anthrone oxygenase family protein n=1 Tax=Chitinophaga sp. W2I13 TaxID=3373923 RepID=UPI003D2257C9